MLNDASYANEAELLPLGLSFDSHLMQLVLNKVLMLGSQTQTIIGRPILPDAAVHAVVEEHVSYFKTHYLSIPLISIMHRIKRKQSYHHKMVNLFIAPFFAR